jgi:hypothetical protein
MEYNSILDRACEEKDPLRRLSLIAVYGSTLNSLVERFTTKPFNPLLGETYEFVTPDFKYIAEQVSHHPPVTAVFCEGRKYQFSTCQATQTSFNGTMLKVTHQFRAYIYLPEL